MTQISVLSTLRIGDLQYGKAISDLWHDEWLWKDAVNSDPETEVTHLKVTFADYERVTRIFALGPIGWFRAPMLDSILTVSGVEKLQAEWDSDGDGFMVNYVETTRTSLRIIGTEGGLLIEGKNLEASLSAKENKTREKRIFNFFIIETTWDRESR